MLYCPNYTCQAPNSEANRFCQKCRTPLPQRYLWAVGSGSASVQPGDVLLNRYLCKSPRIFLDTKPGLLPTEYTDITQRLAPYLRLSPYQLHVPQIHELIQFNGRTDASLLLLDRAAVHTPPVVSSGGPHSQDIQVHLLPALVDVWHLGTALRQVNWLWQMAQLWQPCTSEGVASTLLSPELVRVESGIIRLLELRTDEPGMPPTLAQLGQLWSAWSATAHVDVASSLSQLSDQLIQGQFLTAEPLVDHLDRLLKQVGRSPSRQIQIATRSDRGPSRQRNEDACYPPADTVTTHPVELSASTPSSVLPLVIVCDGIGGHEGGDVASHLAIETISHQLRTLDLESLDPVTLSVELEKIACAANDVISQQNDTENRYERQRMGTTLVMVLIRGHELYLTHVGDSRAYWVTRWNCHQITMDDDVASREVRLGYSLYREALQQPGSGSLVQALGMASSTSLHPTVQRFILDEDSVFLLCSDGLSDGDRVEGYWETTILPLLEGKAEIGAVSQQLIHIANTCNGHDNSTVGLMYVKVSGSKPIPLVAEIPLSIPPLSDPTSPPQIVESDDESAINPPAQIPPVEGTSTLKTQILTAPTPSKFFNPFPVLLTLSVLLGLGAGLVYLFLPGFSPLISSSNDSSATPTPSPVNPSVSPSSPQASQPTLGSLEVGSYVQIEQPLEQSDALANPLVLVSQPPSGSTSSSDPASTTVEQVPPQALGLVPEGSVVYVVKRQSVAQNFWLELRVCSTPDAVTPDAVPPSAVAPSSDSADQLKPLLRGQSGWVQERLAASMAKVPEPVLLPAPQDLCIPSSSSPQAG